MRFITSFSDQHQTVRWILSKHWHLLQADPNVCNFISNSPQITFKRAPSLKDELVSNHFKDSSPSAHCESAGTFRCNNCDICLFIHTSNSIKLPNGQHFQSCHFTDCNTLGIVHLFQCECSCFYVGKIISPFHRRVRENIYSINIGKLSTSLGWHAGRQDWCPYTHPVWSAG